MEISRASARLMIDPRTAKIEEKKKSKDNENDTPSRISQLEISRVKYRCVFLKIFLVLTVLLVCRRITWFNP